MEGEGGQGVQHVQGVQGEQTWCTKSGCSLVERLLSVWGRTIRLTGSEGPGALEAPVALVERAVVACFLGYIDKICLLKRSQAVGSARGRWHCISGYVEPGVGALEQAIVEIGEETGLMGEAIRLVAAPEPLRIERPAQGWVWVIHPFLFDTASRDLVLDWEHDEYRWIEPRELAAIDCVSWLEPVWAAVSSEEDSVRSP